MFDTTDPCHYRINEAYSLQPTRKVCVEIVSAFSENVIDRRYIYY